MNKTAPKAALAAAILSLSLALTGCATTAAPHSDPNASHMSTGDEKMSEQAAFAMMMIPHHLQAIKMSAYAKENAQDPQVLELAKQIYTAQAAEIATMQGWLGDIQVPDHTMSDGMLTDEQMTALADAKGADFDKLFLEGMTAHHKGALVMATDFQNTDDPELKTLVTQILQVQTIELSMMKLLAAK